LAVVADKEHYFDLGVAIAATGLGLNMADTEALAIELEVQDVIVDQRAISENIVNQYDNQKRSFYRYLS
jgi:hypothetical protein